MRVRVIRWTDPTSSQATLRVLRWCDAQWEPVKDFPLNESEQANEFAMRLSMSKREPTELAMFEDGEKVQRFDPLTEATRHLFAPPSGDSETVSEKQI